MNQTNKELIKATREFRDVMTADTAIIEIAKMLSTSADRLDVTTAALREVTKQCDAKDVIIQQLAAENAGLKSVISENWNMRDVLRQLIAGRPGGCYFIKWEPLILKALNDTPVTGAALAEIRAQVLDEFANAQDEQAKKHYDLSPGSSGQHECQYAAGQAWYFAECIRKGAAV